MYKVTQVTAIQAVNYHNGYGESGANTNVQREEREVHADKIQTLREETKAIGCLGGSGCFGIDNQ
jgi:hypothetical protein